GCAPGRDGDRWGKPGEDPDPDREPLDRDEVEPLDEREPDDAVEDEETDLVARDPQAARSREREEDGEAEDSARGAELREAQARHVRSREDDFRDGAVDGEEHRRRGDHRIAESRMRSDGSALAVEDDLRHRARLARVMVVVAQLIDDRSNRRRCCTLASCAWRSSSPAWRTRCNRPSAARPSRFWSGSGWRSS